MIKGYNFPMGGGSQVKIDGEKHNGQLDLYTYKTTLKEESDKSLVPNSNPPANNSKLYRDNMHNFIYITEEKNTNEKKQYILHIQTRKHNEKFDSTNAKNYSIKVENNSEDLDLSSVKYEIRAESSDKTGIVLYILISYKITGSTKRWFNRYRIDSTTSYNTEDSYVRPGYTEEFSDVIGYCVNSFGEFAIRQKSDSPGKATISFISPTALSYWEIDLYDQNTKLSTDYIYEVIRYNKKYYLFYWKPAGNYDNYDKLLCTELDKQDWSVIDLQKKESTKLRISHIYIKENQIYYMYTPWNNSGTLYKIMDIDSTPKLEKTVIRAIGAVDFIQNIYFDVNNEPLYLSQQTIKDNKDIEFQIASILYKAPFVSDTTNYPQYTPERLTSVLLLTYSEKKQYFFEDYETIDSNYKQIYFKTSTSGFNKDYYEKYILGPAIYTTQEIIEKNDSVD